MKVNATPYFSVIIPVYNVQDYLEECVESVLHQTFLDFEVILVDDGSKDRSGALCDALAQKDSRILVHHQENQGLSGARNSGLALAKGEYILFLDSDDFYPQTDFLEKIASVSDHADIICFNYARYTDRLLGKMLAYPENSFSDDQLWLELTRRNAYQSSACIKAVKRELLQKNDITFERGTLSEDIEWSAKVLLSAGSVALAPDCIYAYRVRQGSISKTVSPRHVADQVRIISTLSRNVPEGSQAFQDAYNGYVAFQYSALMINLLLSKPKVDRELRRKVKDLAWLLQYDTNRIVKLIHMVKRILGFEITSRLLLVYFKLFCK